MVLPPNARSITPSSVAALDPADEPANMDTAGQQALVLPRTQLRRLLILRPLVHEALETRNVEHAAAKRRGFDTLEVAADIVALGVKGAKPCRFCDAQAGLV